MLTVVSQIPNEPITFPTDPTHANRDEDAIIAFTWAHFHDNTSAPEWLLRLPMTKAAVRSLDTTTSFLKEKTGNDVQKFIVAGASKRGWATWTTGAVDKRVVAICPMVMGTSLGSRNLSLQPLGLKERKKKCKGQAAEEEEIEEERKGRCCFSLWAWLDFQTLAVLHLFRYAPSLFL